MIKIFTFHVSVLEKKVMIADPEAHAYIILAIDDCVYVCVCVS